MQELWRKPDFVNVNDFDASMFSFLLRAQETNEHKSNVEEQRSQYFDSVLDDKYKFTEANMNVFREKLGANFVLESYSKEALFLLLNQVDKKHKRSNERTES